jgi:hypothetical protein
VAGWNVGSILTKWLSSGLSIAHGKKVKRGLFTRASLFCHLLDVCLCRMADHVDAELRKLITSRGLKRPVIHGDSESFDQVL